MDETMKGSPLSDDLQAIFMPMLVSQWKTFEGRGRMWAQPVKERKNIVPEGWSCVVEGLRWGKSDKDRVKDLEDNGESMGQSPYEGMVEEGYR
jgi:hypothetical protein